MGQPVELSDSLVLDAHHASKLAERSISEQIELWAAIGRAIEPLLHYGNVLELKRRSAAKPLSECFRKVGTKAGRKQLKAILENRPFPRYEPAKDRPDYLVRIEEDGTRTTGKFVNRKFIPL